MQRLVWQNSKGDEINLTSGNYGITEWQGFSNADLNVQSQQVPFQDGAVFLDALIEPRELSVTLKMQDKGNLEERYRMRRKLIHILNPKLGEGYLIYTNDFISKRIKCVAQIPLFETHNSDTRGTPKASLAWTACEPYWEDIEETEINISYGENVKINNTGDVDIQIEAEIKDGGNNVTLKNDTSNERISLNGNTPSIININTGIGIKKITTKSAIFEYCIGGQFNSMATNGNIVVIVGKVICVMDKNENVRYILKAESELHYVTFQNNIFVAVGDDGIVYRSLDGENWNYIKIGINRNLTSVAYGDGKWIAVGIVGIVLSSIDLVQWTPVTFGDTVNLTSICYRNSKSVSGQAYSGFFVCGDNKIFTSEHGTNWSNIYTATYNFYSVCTYGQEVVATGANGLIVTSTGNIINTSWTVITNTSTQPIYDCIFVNRDTETTNYESAFYFFGRNGRIAKLEYGSTTLTNLDYTSNVLRAGVLFNNSIYATGVRSGIIKIGIPSDTEKSIIRPFINAINWNCFGNGMHVFVGESGSIFTTSDGLKFEKQSVTSIADIMSVTFEPSYMNGYFIAGTVLGEVLTSPNGISWSKNTTLNNAVITYISYFDYNGGMWIIFARNRQNTSQYLIYTSSDLINFTLVSNSMLSMSNPIIYEVKYVDGIFYAVGMAGSTNVQNADYGFILTNETLEGNWNIVYKTSEISGVPNRLSGIIINRNKVIVTGTNIILSSFTGHPNDWVVESTDADCWAIIKDEDGVLYGVPRSGDVVKSADGSSWANVKTEYDGVLYYGAYGNGMIFMSGVTEEGSNDGLILVSKYETLNLLPKLTTDSNMGLSLKKGNNIISLMSDYMGTTGKIKFRQKYIGV